MKPKLLKIVKNDYLVLLSFVAPLVIWGIFLFLYFNGTISGVGRNKSLVLAASDAPFFLIMAIIFSLVFVSIGVWRIKQIKNIFSNGIEVTGKVLKITFYKDRGRLEYEYTLEDYSYRSNVGIHKTGEVIELQSGHPLKIIVHRDNSLKSVVADLYL